MASVHSMPPDTREREKIVGGILDFVQLIWVVIGLVICAVITMTFYRALSWFALVFGLPFVIGGLILALGKKDSLPLPKYIRLKVKHNTKVKFFINSGFKSDLDFTAEEEE